jgi:hypothetical protein
MASGVLLPGEMPGRSSLWRRRHASALSLPSVTDRNQCWSRHSCRDQLFRAPVGALSVGFLGWTGSSNTPCQYAQRPSAREVDPGRA